MPWQVAPGLVIIGGAFSVTGSLLYLLQGMEVGATWPCKRFCSLLQQRVTLLLLHAIEPAHAIMHGEPTRDERLQPLTRPLIASRRRRTLAHLSPQKKPLRQDRFDYHLQLRDQVATPPNSTQERRRWW